MIFSKEQIVNDISNFIVRFAGRPQNCYIGISKDALERLFRGHQVQIMNMNDFRFYRAESSEEARAIERFFLDRGLQGGSGGGDDESDMIYVYRITAETKQ